MSLTIARCVSANARITANTRNTSRASVRARRNAANSSRGLSRARIQSPSVTRQHHQSSRGAVAANALPAMSAILSTHYALPALWVACAPAVALAYINPIYSFSIGYGLSILFASAFVHQALVASGTFVTTMLALHVAGGAAYGARLAAFLFYRSVTWDEWRERAKNAPEANAKSFAKQTLVIALCSALYAMMSSPMMWHAQNVNAVNAAKYAGVIAVGLALEWVGLILEAVADQQKFNYKATEEGKTKWCSKGLYKFCRHPNYLGEIMFWVGLYVAGFPAMLTRPITLVPSSLGLLFIVKLMTSAAKRGDKKQLEKYGEDNAAYKAWVESTCSLVPGN